MKPANNTSQLCVPYYASYSITSENLSLFQQRIVYLDVKHNITIMYTLFLGKYPDLPIKYSFYYKTFKENYDYGFSHPHIDICCECETRYIIKR